MTTSNYLVVFNPLPNRNRTRRLDKLVAKLKQKSLSYTLYPTAPTQKANQVFFDKHHSEFSDVIVVGGDGTFNLMLNILIQYDFKVGLLPAGTGNDFARAWYGVNRNNLEHVLDVVTQYSVTDMTLGYCDFIRDNERRVYFHNVLGIGFDAAIASALRHNKGRVPSLSYLLAALWYIPFYKEPYCELKGVEVDAAYRNFMTVFANSKYFGSGLPIAPNAKPTEGHLQLVKLAQQPLFIKFKLLLRLLLGRHTDAEQIQFKEVTKPVSVVTAGLDIEADGEYLGQSPCTIGKSAKVIHLKR